MDDSQRKMFLDKLQTSDVKFVVTPETADEVQEAGFHIPDAIERTTKPTDEDFYVCALKTDYSLYNDDRFGVCCKCGTEIRFRPHAPTEPKKICVACALKGFLH